MPEAPIPFTNKEASGFSELAGASPIAFNVLTDGTGAVHRRPGLRVRSGVTSSVVDADGIAGLWVANNGAVYAVGNAPRLRHIYKVTTSADDLSILGPARLTGTGRPVFTETDALLVIAGGQDIHKVDLVTGDTGYLGGTPPTATHVAGNSARILANDTVNRNQVHYSGQAAGSSITGHEQWSVGVGTAGFFSGEARPDPVVAIADNANEVFVWGSRTLQVFAPDPQAVLAPVVSRQVGMAAPHSLIANDQSFAWLDDQNRFVVSDGRGFEVISDPIAQTLDNLTTVSDCFGYRVNEGFADVLVWTFPTHGLTFAYQQGVGWCRWAGWNGNWSAFPVTAKDINVATNIVGLSDGRIGELSRNSVLDYEAPIRAYIETGALSRGTDARKMCKRVRLSLKRGKSTGSAPQAKLGWRDRPGVVSGSIPVSLGTSPDTEVVVVFPSLGVYRRRQWFFEFTGTEELVLASATEEFEVLGD